MYEVIGNFETGKFHCNIKDIFPMAKGSGAATEYEFDKEFIKYRMSNPKSLYWEIGNCHSHNNMQTFFSSTDISDLQENSESHNYYLSLIVNNNLDTCAKISFIGEQETKQDTVRTFFGDNGKVYKLKIKDTKKEKVLFVYNCKIELDYSIKVDSDFAARTEEIIKNYSEASKVVANNYKSLIPTTSRRYYDPNEEEDYNYDIVQDSWFKEAYQKQSVIDKTGIHAIEIDSDGKTSLDKQVEQLLIDSLLGEYGSELTVDVAMERANDNFIKDPKGTINLVTTFLQTLGLEYFEEEFLASDEFLESIAESIYMYEGEYPEFINTLADELLEEVI